MHKPPYLDMRYRPRARYVVAVKPNGEVVFGKQPPRKNPNNPQCPRCRTNEKVEILCYALVTSDGVYKPEHYRCYRCGCGF